MMELFERIKRKKKRLLAERNFEVNARCDADPVTTTENRLVCDQNGVRGRAFVYGDYPARRNACEAIAVHNARVLLGRESSLSETIALFQALGAMIFRGFFGSNVYKIKRVLRALDIPFEKVKRKGLGRPGVYIVSFWNEKPLKNGIHTVALTYDGEKYTTYNLHGNGAASGEDPRDYAKRFIVGYYLGKAVGGSQ